MGFAKRLIGLLVLISLFLLAGCSTTGRQYCGEFPVENLKQVKPQYVAVKDGKLEYYRFGAGSPLVLVEGYGTDITSWDRDFLAGLAQQHDVIVFNNRNVGGSVVKSQHYASQDMAKDTYHLIKALKLKKPAVLGLSMGGMVAQDFAIHYPKALSRLILINTVVAGDQALRPSPEVVKSLREMPDSKIRRYFLAIDLFSGSQPKMQMAVALASDRFLPQNYTEVEPSLVKQQQSLFVMDWFQDNAAAKKLAKLSLPVLILNGREDHVIPPLNSNILYSTIPNSRLITWRDGGHGMLYQYPQEIAHVVNKFLG